MKSQRRYDAAWARKVESAFKGAVAQSFTGTEVAERLLELGCRRAELPSPAATDCWRTPKGRLLTVPRGELSASLLQDILLTLRELDRSVEF